VRRFPPTLRRRGFTLIELLVVICVVAVTFGVALDRLLKYQELAERAALEQNLGAVNVALTMKFAALVSAGRGAQIEKEVGANPVNLLARPPENYLGELYAPEPASVARGSWYFDLRSRDLVYVPSRSRFLTFSRAVPDGNLRFRILLTEAGGDPDAPREIRQPYIGALVPFRWVVE
jgi:prepilin-type N-terminal cleavage/methylation domain-containing protein